MIIFRASRGFSRKLGRCSHSPVMGFCTGDVVPSGAITGGFAKRNESTFSNGSGLPPLFAVTHTSSQPLARKCGGWVSVKVIPRETQARLFGAPKSALSHAAAPTRASTSLRARPRAAAVGIRASCGARGLLASSLIEATCTPAMCRCSPVPTRCCCSPRTRTGRPCCCRARQRRGR